MFYDCQGQEQVDRFTHDRITNVKIEPVAMQVYRVRKSLSGFLDYCPVSLDPNVAFDIGLNRAVSAPDL
jgi:hypothetical protein